jgi:hypothetical protein
MVLLCIFDIKSDEAVPNHARIRCKVVMQRLMTSVILRGEFGLDKYSRSSCWKHDEEAGAILSRNKGRTRNQGSG